MTALALDRDTALRIALAARSLPDIELTSLIDILDECLGSPLDLTKLSRITVTDLKTSLASLDGEEDGEDIGIGLDPMKLAVRILWGETDEDDELPEIEAYQDGDIPDSIRVGISSNSANNLDGHFGSCLRFLIYQVSATEMRLIDIRSAAEADLSDDRNAYRANIVKDCEVLYMVSVGGPAAAKIIRAGIYPLKRIEGGEAVQVIKDFQQVMSGTPPPWLAKILGVTAEQRLKNYRGSDKD